MVGRSTPQFTRTAVLRWVSVVGLCLGLLAGFPGVSLASPPKARQTVRVCHGPHDRQELHLKGGPVGCSARHTLTLATGAKPAPAHRKTAGSSHTVVGVAVQNDQASGNSSSGSKPSVWSRIASTAKDIFLIFGFGLLALVGLAAVGSALVRPILVLWLTMRGRQRTRRSARRSRGPWHVGVLAVGSTLVRGLLALRSLLPKPLLNLGSILLKGLLNLGLWVLRPLLLPGSLLLRGLWSFVTWLLRSLTGPARLQIEPFEDAALSIHSGAALAAMVQTRLTGGREGGPHLYTVTGEQQTNSALSALQASPQTQPLAAALALLKLVRVRPRLTVRGSLVPATQGVSTGRNQRVILALSMSLESRMVASVDFGPTEMPSTALPGTASSRVLAVMAAGWIQHCAVDYTPGPHAGRIFSSGDARSWALFRAGSELQSMSLVKDAADAYEQALAIDPENIGALVDLSYLRRRDKDFDRAVRLARRAISHVRRRCRESGVPTMFDPDWYRAQIVLATTYAVWARDLRNGSVTTRPRDDTDPELESKRIARQVAIRARRAQVRLEPLEPWYARPGSPRSRRLSWCERRRYAPNEAALRELLKATFEPGALLIFLLDSVGSPSRVNAEGSTPPTPNPRQWRETLRSGSTLNESDFGGMLRHVEALQVKAPRLHYNLACYYSLAASRPTETGEEMDRCREHFRRSIQRTDPSARRGLLTHAQTDPDLKAMRDETPELICDLWKSLNIPGRCPPDPTVRAAD